MNRWFTCSVVEPPNGSFAVYQLEPLNNDDVGANAEFVEQLANHVAGYIATSNTDVANVFNDRYQITVEDRDLVPRGLEQLLAIQSQNRPVSGGTTETRKTLLGFVGECLAHWTLRTFAPPLATALATSVPEYGSTTPAFDLVQILDHGGAIEAGCVQAKASHGRAMAECNGALDKYEVLHRGDSDYDYQLTQKLTMLVWLHPEVKDRFEHGRWRDVLLDRDRRHYGVFAAFSGATPETGLTMWGTKVPCAVERRALIVLPFAHINALVERVAEVLRARIA